MCHIEKRGGEKYKDELEITRNKDLKYLSQYLN
jgi:hypothetical protein